ncbi:MAG: glycosyltransferase [Bacteroidia bacterium]
MLPQKIPFKNKRVLVCPLDWGLGHTARCIALIKALQEKENHVIVACNASQRDFIQKEIAGPEYTELFGYEVTYSKYTPLWMALLTQFGRLRSVVKKEHAWLENFLADNKIDVVISDNRFGLYSDKSDSIFITHQVFIKAPFLSWYINLINRSYIRKFRSLWIVDCNEENNSLAGKLSHNAHFHPKVKYIGPLSRFTKKQAVPEKKFDVLVLLSGVEPQRTLLEEKCVSALQNTGLKICLVRGTYEASKIIFPENFKVVNVAQTTELEDLLLTSEKIICRSGYSSLMDLHALGLKAILIPTPGQTEQEYLAGYWKEKFGFAGLGQKEITYEKLLKALSEV